MDQQAAHKLLAEAETIHSADAVQAALDAVAARIRARLADKNPLVLCVMAGGVIFCGQLLPKLDFPLDFDYLHATRYGADTQGRSCRSRRPRLCARPAASRTARSP